MTGTNLFAYCGNNPVNRIDHTGAGSAPATYGFCNQSGELVIDYPFQQPFRSISCLILTGNIKGKTKHPMCRCFFVAPPFFSYMYVKSPTFSAIARETLRTPEQQFDNPRMFVYNSLRYEKLVFCGIARFRRFFGSSRRGITTTYYVEDPLCEPRGVYGKVFSQWYCVLYC